MNMHAIDISSMPVRARYLDPDAPDPVLEKEAREAAREDYIDMWAEDGLVQQFLADYRHGDAAEFDQRSGELARALEKHIRGQA